MVDEGEFAKAIQFLDWAKERIAKLRSLCPANYTSDFHDTLLYVKMCDFLEEHQHPMEKDQ